MTEEQRIALTTVLKQSRDYEDDVIEATVIDYVCSRIKRKFVFKDEFEYLKDLSDKELFSRFDTVQFPVEIEFIIEFFEELLDKKRVNENGIVFTPKYISDYICNSLIKKNIKIDSKISVIDPGCGCGIFLVSAIDEIRKKVKKSISSIINSNIYGIELDKDNARRCKIVLNLYALMQGESNSRINANIACLDSLKTDWNEVFKKNGFDCIVGNPPYVNTHDMNKETSVFLKKNFKTTTKGVYNIFYAFIEHAMQFLATNGNLSYIVPNNFLTIKSAESLRQMIIENGWMESIIDFADNMVFKPVRTYNCIIKFNNKKNNKFKYSVMKNTDDIEKELRTISYNTMDMSDLNVNGWKLVDRITLQNIEKIESQEQPIKEFIRTGIATLRDNVYIVDYDGKNYYKNVDEKKYVIEKTLVKKLYKIPELKKAEKIDDACKYIIFPYKKGLNGFEIITETDLKKKTPYTYKYLKSQKKVLDERDKGKPNNVSWFAYGRSQGLNKYGRKLLFPTFADVPKFLMIEDEESLFCNGYAVFENDYLDLDILVRILNSKIMQYYVNNTSYAIEGGYYCYQKKYIEKFSIPHFSEKEKNSMKGYNDKELNEFLIKKYDIKL